jgi:hypothetical protein
VRPSTTKKRAIVEEALNVRTVSVGGTLWETYTSTELMELIVALSKRGPSNMKSFQHLLQNREE